ncbi:alkyl and aryl transferase [Trypanosoma rangeli]|uniref:Alkyl and aryl transferase n=1 Tax=Trypanosoma rangeli TaxID=5698 RepID=A0A422NWV9_TRYRA|nr:alkyl and aryl transferase [Trypanosoma rangeli]RNF09919.1 alkyl and aryl transferase [Trypanosoma rangeli]|eukprot:RNF09919.1 alkyl and aryl transferase [Trypanosoma rangeli]
MQPSDALTEVAEQLHAALESAARQLRAGRRVRCSLALLPSVALAGMPHRWGTVEVIQLQEDLFELLVGVGSVMLAESFMGLLRRLQHPFRSLTDGGDPAPPIIGPLVKRLPPEGVLAVSLLLLPAHTDLWNGRRRGLRETARASAVAEERVVHFLLPLLLQEILLTSLLLSFHYKKQEVWVHRWWVVHQILTLDDLDLEAFHTHDRAVLFEAADGHPMNYNAWNYRRQVFACLFKRENITEGTIRALLLEELNAVVEFFERHNGDTSATVYLTFLLEQATARWGATDDGHKFVASHVWRRLLSVTAQELRRHYDKGHEAVWVLRLALMRWALWERPSCGWTLQDELEFIDTYAAVATVLGEEEGGANMRPDITWVNVSGSCWWTSYHAVRYGVQLLRML